MLLAVVAIVVALYASACAALFFFQRSLIYFPQPRSLGERQLASFTRDGVTLNLTVRPHAGPGAVLYFGGNGEDVSGSLGPLVQAFPDRELVLLHYRGYGGSGGQPSEEAIAQDAVALFDRVRASHPDVLVIGRSLGSGVAVRLASVRPASAVVLVTPYDSVLTLAQARFRMFPVSWLLQDKFESWRYAPGVSVPTLLLAAGQDEVIPLASTQRLATRFAPGVAHLRIFPGAGHDTISEEPGYAPALASVLSPRVQLEDDGPAPAGPTRGIKRKRRGFGGFT